MTVYLVWEWRDLYGVFSSREKAEAAASELPSFVGAEIQEYIVDEKPDPYDPGRRIKA